MIREDLEHKLLCGSPIYIGDCPTYKITLEDMANHGFRRMQNVISIMSQDDNAVSQFAKDDIVPQSMFYMLAIVMIQDLHQKDNGNVSNRELFCDVIPEFLSLFFKKKVSFDENKGFVVKDEDGSVVLVLDDTNYSQFRDILKYRNCLVDFDGVGEDNPANDMAAQLLAKKKMLQAKIDKVRKSNGEEGLTMADLISIFAEAESMPLQDVYRNYDIYQFNNQFNRLKIMDDFHVNIQALLAGAKSEDVKLQHWLSKIKGKEQ